MGHGKKLEYVKQGPIWSWNDLRESLRDHSDVCICISNRSTGHLGGERKKEELIERVRVRMS